MYCTAIIIMIIVVIVVVVVVAWKSVDKTGHFHSGQYIVPRLAMIVLATKRKSVDR